MAAAPKDDAGDAAETFDVIAKMPADAWLHIIARLEGRRRVLDGGVPRRRPRRRMAAGGEARQLFGGGGGTGAASSSSEAPTARHECRVSEQLRGGRAPPSSRRPSRPRRDDVGSSSAARLLSTRRGDAAAVEAPSAAAWREGAPISRSAAPSASSARAWMVDAPGRGRLRPATARAACIFWIWRRRSMEEQCGPFGPRGTRRRAADAKDVQRGGAPGLRQATATAAAGCGRAAPPMLAALLDEAAGEDRDDDNDAERDQYTPLAEPVVTARRVPRRPDHGERCEPGRPRRRRRPARGWRMAAAARPHSTCPTRNGG